MFRMDGRVALVTGGHGELAEAIASTLVDLGCDLVLAARKEAECEKLAARLRTTFGPRVTALTCNVASEEDVARTFGHILRTHGRLDVLVNNAGTSHRGLAEDTPFKGRPNGIDLNVTVTFP